MSKNNSNTLEEKYADALYQINTVAEEYQQQILQKIPNSACLDNRSFRHALLTILKEYI